MPAPLFVQAGEDRFEPTEHSRGPWDLNLLHGGPVAALLAHQLYDRASPGQRWHPSRLTVDFVRPLQLSPLQVVTSELRTGRKAALLGADCLLDGVLMARATLQLVAIRDVPLPPESGARWVDPVDPPENLPQVSPVSLVGDVAFHLSSVEHRSSDHPLSGGGPASDWIRVRANLFEGTPLSPFERVVCAADFSNGISSSLPFDEYTFVNADLTVHTFRLPVDEWVQVAARTFAGDRGTGVAESQLLDRQGLLGRACQTLVISLR